MHRSIMLLTKDPAHMRFWKRFAFSAVALAAAGCTAEAPKSALREPATDGVPTVMRRLTQSQYKNVIADVFGPGIRVAGSMDPDFRKDGLLAIGAAEATFSPSSLEQADALARGIAADVLSEKNRQSLLPCAPAAEAAPDPACAAQTLKLYGRLLFRRPLTSEELGLAVGLANDQAQKLKGFSKGLEYGLASLLVSPNFLFQTDVAVADPKHRGQFHLDAYSRAARLSFFLWNSGPDDLLLAAAETGALDTDKGLAREVDRLLSSPRIKDGVRAFFDDFLRFSELKTLTKDTTIYPRFSLPISEFAREQTLRTIEDILVTQDGDFRTLFTTRKTFLNRPLGVAYRVAVPVKNGWMPYEFPADDPRAGILTHLSFTALYALPGRSSPTLRGKAIREVFLCQRVPDPPNNVDFSKFEDPKSEIKTVRARLEAHATSPVCAGCHKLIDPMGLSLEKFDGLGTYRTAENGVAIDASGQLDTVKFDDATGLGATLANNPQASSCFITQLFAYGAGHKPTAEEAEWVKFVQNQFAAGGYKAREALRRIATSDNFYRVQTALQDTVKTASVK